VSVAILRTSRQDWQEAIDEALWIHLVVVFLHEAECGEVDLIGEIVRVGTDHAITRRGHCATSRIPSHLLFPPLPSELFVAQDSVKGSIDRGKIRQRRKNPSIGFQKSIKMETDGIKR
jgi:hypothetical protein